jgi:hypothetical protein
MKQENISGSPESEQTAGTECSERVPTGKDGRNVKLTTHVWLVPILKALTLHSYTSTCGAWAQRYFTSTLWESSMHKPPPPP